MIRRTATTIALFLAFAFMPCRGEYLRYVATKAGIKIAEMTIEKGVSTNSLPYCRLRIRNCGPARLFTRVDTEMSCETVASDDGVCTVFRRRTDEGGLRHNDLMRLWPETGLAVLENLETGSVVTSRVDVGSQDVATFFCNVGESLGLMRERETDELSSAVIFEGTAHEVVLKLGERSTLRTVCGKMDAVAMEVETHSRHLFVRNRPKRIMVSVDSPVFLEMDIENRYGTARFRLAEWRRDVRECDAKAARPAAK